jgi:hypothetical protein
MRMSDDDANQFFVRPEYQNLHHNQNKQQEPVEEEEVSKKKFLTTSDLALTNNDENSNLNAQSAKPIATTVKKKGKPILSLLQVSPSNASSADSNYHNSNNNQPSNMNNNNGVGGMKNPALNASNSSIRISPHGTFHMGKIKIMENGIFSDEHHQTNSTVSKSFYFSRENSADSRTFHSKTALDEKSNRILLNQSSFKAPIAMGGKKDFIEIGTLGSGASGVVTEAIHVPSLTIVALKMLPVYNQEKRQHVSRELAVLYKNLAELKLVDDSLTSQEDTSNISSDNGNIAKKKSPQKCENILSLYNAFIDPKSGMINLVIEYMDGGSLEDLVRQGGCTDERVLADISYQTIKGLHFLHKNGSVHRDIKPANILCSSNGVVKIADFGISRALDKTSGFANSFIGTVCYMSP